MSAALRPRRPRLWARSTPGLILGYIPHGTGLRVRKSAGMNARSAHPSAADASGPQCAWAAGARMKLSVLLLALPLAVSAFAAGPLLDLRPSQPETIRPTIRLDANLVLVPVTVIDRWGRLIPGLHPSDFTLRENDSPQQ